MSLNQLSIKFSSLVLFYECVKMFIVERWLNKMAANTLIYDIRWSPQKKKAMKINQLKLYFLDCR